LLGFLDRITARGGKQALALPGDWQQAVLTRHGEQQFNPGSLPDAAGAFDRRQAAHFMRALDIATTAVPRQGDHRAVAWERM
jgi:hypothetical protein